MSDNSTKHMLPLYEQVAPTKMFLSGLFQTPRINFYNSESVELDILRSDEDIAIVVQDMTVGSRRNSMEIGTNKEFTAPVYSESIPLNSFDLLKREAGNNPFADVSFRSKLQAKLLRGMSQIDAKIKRAIELQASQIFQTGVLDLKDSSGTTLFTLDYKPKATHFPTVGTSWSAGGSTKLADLASLANVIRADGKTKPDQLIMGNGAYFNFVSDDEVRKFYNNDIRMGQSSLTGTDMNAEDAVFRGVVDIENYKYDVWTYDGQYKDPQTSSITKYVEDDKVIMRASKGRMDATFGDIPNIGRILGQQKLNLLPQMAGRFSSARGGMDLITNLWLSNDGKTLEFSVESRPLLIPTAIDTYGCLDTII
jgi:hypothetical protein